MHGEYVNAGLFGLFGSLIYLAFLALIVYVLILFIRLGQRGIQALDIYIQKNRHYHPNKPNDGNNNHN